MYTLYMQKSKGDHEPFMIRRELTEFLLHTRANSIVFSPGYICGATAVHSPGIPTLLNGVFTGTDIERFGILNSMNNRQVDDYCNIVRGRIPGVNIINFDRNERTDHRKMIFIYQDNQAVPDPFTEREIQNHVDTINMLGVFIGSSNFSYTTYLGGASGTANKGEADILMFNDEEYADTIIDRNQNMRNMVLSESITPVANDFLKDIYKSVLEQSLG